MSRSKVLISCYIMIALFSFITYYNISNTSELKVVDRFVVTYLPNVTGVAVYEQKSQNTMKCNLTTVNIIIQNMIYKDYFYILKDYSEGNLLDIVLTNDEDTYRILYNRRTRDFMCVSNPFLKNYVPMTYILD